MTHNADATCPSCGALGRTQYLLVTQIEGEGWHAVCKCGAAGPSVSDDVADPITASLEVWYSRSA